MGPLSALHGSFTGSSASNKTWTELSPLLGTNLISLYSSAALELPRRLPNCANKALKPISRGQPRWRRRRWLDRSKGLMDASIFLATSRQATSFRLLISRFLSQNKVTMNMHFGNMMHFLAFEPSIWLPQLGPHVSSAIGITSALHVHVSVELHLVQCKPADGLH